MPEETSARRTFGEQNKTVYVLGIGARWLAQFALLRQPTENWLRGDGDHRRLIQNGGRWSTAVDWDHVLVGNFSSSAAEIHAFSAPPDGQAVTAAGFGSFTDRTPDDNEPFLPGGAHGEFVAGPGSEAAARMDLLSVVMHELGHVLGEPHTDGHGLMQPTLVPGIRRLPAVHGLLEEDDKHLDWQDLLDDQLVDYAAFDDYYSR